MQLLHHLALATSLPLLSSACSSLAKSPAEQAPMAPAALRALPIFHARTGESVSFEDLLVAVDGADAVILGELHGHPVGLPFHAELFRASLAANPEAAIALEFVTRDGQHLLDAFAADLINWDALAEAQSHIKGSTPVPHRELIDAAKSAGVPVIAANAPRTYTGYARREGFDALKDLSPAQQALFDIPPIIPSGPYRDGFYEQVGFHEEGADPSAPSEDLQGMFRAQCLWDGTMSASVSRALDQGHRPVFLAIGSYHCNNDGGTVQVLRERQPSARILVVSFEAVDSLELLEDDRSAADFIIYAGSYPSPE